MINSLLIRTGLNIGFSFLVLFNEIVICFYSEQVDLIRQVMSGITLPSSAIPEWAKVVPEEKWKASLVSTLTNRTGSQPDSAKTAD